MQKKYPLGSLIRQLLQLRVKPPDIGFERLKMLRRLQACHGSAVPWPTIGTLKGNRERLRVARPRPAAPWCDCVVRECGRRGADGTPLRAGAATVGAPETDDRGKH